MFWTALDGPPFSKYRNPISLIAARSSCGTDHPRQSQPKQCEVARRQSEVSQEDRIVRQGAGHTDENTNMQTVFQANAYQCI